MNMDATKLSDFLRIKLLNYRRIKGWGGWNFTSEWIQRKNPLNLVGMKKIQI